MTVLSLGIGLIVLAIVGFCASGELQKRNAEDVRGQRFRVSKGYILMMVYLMQTISILAIFIFATLWFTFYHSTPSAWLESTYFQSKSTSPPPTTYRAVPVDILQNNINLVVIAIGIFCGFISFILYVSMQLMKKLLRRMERVNTLV